MEPNIKITPHLFMPGHTISAAIKLHNADRILTPEELTWLLKKFDELNGTTILIAGTSAKIPVLI